MNRISIECINRIRILRTNSLPTSNFSSSSLQTTIDHSNPKPPLNPLYNLLPPSQNPNNIVTLIRSSLGVDNKTHLALLQNDVKSILSHLGPTEISRVLLRCQSDHSSALEFFNWVRSDLGLRPTAQNYSHAIHILAWSQQLSHAMKLLRELIASLKHVSPRQDIFQALVSCTEDCNWSPVVFDMLIKAYVRTGMVREGFVAFGKTVEFGLVPSVVCCNFLLNALARMNSVEQCWTVYEEMVRIGVHPNRHTFNTLTHMLSKFGDVHKVNAFVEKMEDQGFDPDVVTYNILISSYCRTGRLGDAMYLYRIMYRRNVVPDLVSYTALMNGFCKQGRVKEAHQLFHRMVHRGLNPDVVAYNTLIGGYCEEGSMLRGCRSLLNEMLGNGIHPNNLTCRLLIRGYRKEGKLISALNLVAELERFGVRVSSENYDFLMVALCRENRPFAAKSLWERISRDGYHAGGVIYTELVQSLCRCDYGSEALLVKQDMLRNGNVKPGLAVYGGLVECLCRIGRSEEGESVMREVVESGVLPGPEMCRALVRGYCREIKFEKAESVLVFFAEKFRVCDTESYNALVKALSERGGGDATELLDLQSRMQRTGFVPNGLTCKYVIKGLRRSERIEQSESFNESNEVSVQALVIK